MNCKKGVGGRMKCSRTRVIGRAAVTMLAACLSRGAATNAPVADKAADGIYDLDQFGPVTTRALADETFARASSNIIAAGGGVLLIPDHAAAGWVPRNESQQVWRKPEAPAPATHWGLTPGVTVIDPRGESMDITTPQVGGLTLNRTLNLKEGESLPFWGYYPLLSIRNTILHGSTSYREWLLEDVKAGKDRRFYVATIRGVFPGMFMSIGEYGVVQRLYVKSLGYDKDKARWYFVADVEADLHKGTIMGNKNHVNVMRMETYSHNENQTCDMLLERHNYSQGDNYMYYARMKYMGDNHSTAGDENAILYGAFINSDTDIFRGKVDQWNPGTGELRIANGRSDTLGSGRPIINMNPAKWLTNGTVCVGGGKIRFAASAGLTDEVVGRYFAVDEPDEYVPKAKNVRRWYLISRVDRHLNGTADISIIWHFWGAKDSSHINLYKPAHYSDGGQDRPLRYIIAPGANAYDVSDAVNNSRRVIKLVPTSFTGSKADFAPGDDVEQAIGPDPFQPTTLRSWSWESIPSHFPSPVLDIANYGEVMRHSVLSVRGGWGDIKGDMESRYDRNPPWHTIISLESASHIGIRFLADVGEAAIQFAQPHGRAQPIQWMFKPDGEKAGKAASLTVSPTNGDFRLEGGDVRLSGSLVTRGLSASATAARNLRGKDVPVEEGAGKASIVFALEEANDEYAVFLEQNWLANRAVVSKSPKGFTVIFDKPAPRGAKLDWMIVQ